MSLRKLVDFAPQTILRNLKKRKTLLHINIQEDFIGKTERLFDERSEEFLAGFGDKSSCI